MIFLKTTNSFHQIISKKAKLTILFLLKNPKNNNIILVISIQYFAYPKDWTFVMKKEIGLSKTQKVSLFLEPLDSSKFVSTNLGAVLARRRGGLRDRLLERVRRGGLRDLLRVGIMGGGLLRVDMDRSLSRLRSRILPVC